MADLFSLVGLQNDEMQQAIKNQGTSGENQNGINSSLANPASVGFGTALKDSNQ